MGLVKKWLTGIGLPPTVVSNFRAAGIVHPTDLLELEVVHYEALGVTDPSDRRKLFFLVQRLKQAREEVELNGGEEDGEEDNDDDGEQGESEDGQEMEAEDEEAPPPPESAAIEAEEADRPRRSTRSRRTDGDAVSVLESVPDGSGGIDDAAAGDDSADKGATRSTRSATDKNGKNSSTRPNTGKSSTSTAPATRSTRSARSSARATGEKADSPASASASAASSVDENEDGSNDDAGPNIAAGPNSSAARSSSRSGILKKDTTKSKAASKSKPAAKGDKSPIRSTRSPVRTRDRSPTRSVASSATMRSPIRKAASSPIRTRSRSPVRTTAKSRARSPPRTAVSASAAPSAAGGRARSKSPMGRTTAKSRARSRSPVRGPSPPRSHRTTTKAISNKGTVTKTRSIGTVPSPTKAAGTQTPPGKNRARRKAPEVDLADDIDSDDGDDEEEQNGMALSSHSEHVAISGSSGSSRRIGGTTGGKGTTSRSNSRTHSSNAGGRPGTATHKSKGRSQRPALHKQNSLPSLRSQDANIKLSDEDSSVGSNVSRSKSSTRRRSLGLSSSTTADDNARPPSPRTKGAASESSSAIGGGLRTNGKRQSKLPGPSKIPSRTGGKGLSTIPAERAAIMSPLVKVQLDDDAGIRSRISYHDNDDDDEEYDDAVHGGKSNTKPKHRRSGSLSSTGSSSSRRRLSAPLVRAKSSSDLSSDDEQLSRRSGPKSRRSLGGASRDRKSMSGLARPRSRSSSIGLSRRDASGKQVAAAATKRSATPESVRSEKALSSDIDLSAELDTSTSFSAASSSMPSGTVFVQGVPEDKSWGTQVSRLREATNEAYQLEFGPSGPGPRNDADDHMRIRVVVRKRPMSRSEAAKKDDLDVIHPLDYEGHGMIVVYQPKTRVDLTKEVESIPFAFDNTFDETSNNADIYERTVSGLVPAMFDGKFCNVFAYGQTGSGKTYTLLGSDLTGANAGTSDDSNPGLYYLAAQDVFYLANEQEFQHLTVTASLFEIYSGKLFDLLNGRQPIKCLEDHRGKVCFPGLTEHAIQNADELMQLMEAGAANRSTGITSKNADSSRSHAVLQLSLKNNSARGRKATEHGRLTFIDLAGSERGADTDRACRTTRLEGAEINTSLLALKEVIRALATGDSMKHIPFRGSKLTQVLKESFVGKNNRSVMVACVAPNQANCEHTLNTLRYADRVKERNAETGALAAAVAEASTIKPKKAVLPSVSPKRPATAPVSTSRSFDSGRSRSSLQNILDDDSGDDGAFEEELLVDDGKESEIDVFERERVHTDDSSVLDRLLDSTDGEADSIESVPQPPTNREAAQSLIETHRAVMADMLTMIKTEMNLVNTADSDRETIAEYLGELEDAQEKQLQMIGQLREALLGYYASRSSSSRVE